MFLGMLVKDIRAGRFLRQVHGFISSVKASKKKEIQLLMEGNMAAETPGQVPPEAGAEDSWLQNRISASSFTDAATSR